MSFWESDLGEVTGKAEDAFTKDMFKTIPDGTLALAKIDSFVNVDYEGFKYLNLEWLLIDGDFKAYKVQQKLKVFGGGSFDKDPAKTRYKALNMLKLLYQLFNMKPKHANPPSDQDLAAFTGKMAGIKIRETEPNEKGKQYNWISEVHKSEGFKCETGISVIVTHVNKPFPVLEPVPIDSAFGRNNVVQNGQYEDDIPF